jgi:hypothetical protein
MLLVSVTLIVVVVLVPFLLDEVGNERKGGMKEVVMKEAKDERK